MAVASKTEMQAAFVLRSAALTLTSLVLKTPDLRALATALHAQFAATPGLFDQDPVIVDFTAVREASERIDVSALVVLLRAYKMQPVAAKGGSAAQMEDALAAGLAEAPEGAPPAAQTPPQAAAVEPAVVPLPAAAPGTLFIDRPLRSGQQVYAKGGDLVVLAVVSFGAEVIADGSIHVYAPLRGRAVAGARGDGQARIFALNMAPQLVSIAGTYRTFETPLPAEVAGKAAQVRLDGERLVVEALGG